MKPSAVVRGIVAALLVYALVLLAGGAASSGMEPAGEGELDAVYWVVILSSLAGAALGTAAGAWQARTGGLGVPAAGLFAPAVAVVVAGVLLTAANGGTSETGNLLIYLAHPLGALVGAVAYGSRWVARVA